MPLDMTINLDRLRSVRLKLRRGLVKLTMCSAVGLGERKTKKKKKLRCHLNDVIRLSRVVAGNASLNAACLCNLFFSGAMLVTRSLARVAHNG